MASHLTDSSVDGGVGEGFGSVADMFTANFRERGEVGAAVTIYVDGEPAVDLWAGIADSRTGRAWTKATPAIVFSCSKGVLAICAYLLVQEGRLDLDAPVAHYWPEFGQAGKEDVPVRWLLTHQAGLPSLDCELDRAQVLAWEPVVHALEEQAPLWPPGTAHGYHALTFGWLVGEVIRRVAGEGVGDFVRRRLAEPLGLRLWIGLPPDERDQVAYLLPPLPDSDLEAAQAIREALATPEAQRSFTMGGAFEFPHDERGYVTFNDPDIQAAEIPAANGIADARSLARLYAACVGPVGGCQLLGQDSVRDALIERVHGPQWFGAPDLGERWGTGFTIASPPLSPLLGVGSFGHPGAGGELAFADAERRIGFAYVNNQMGGFPDDRARRLVSALKECLVG